ncbi:unnamed protein product [Hanseniaspora opuntiae]
MSSDKNYLNIALDSKKAANVLKTIPDEKRCQLLTRIHDALKDNASSIKAANEIDLKQSIEQRPILLIDQETGPVQGQLDDNLTLFKKTVPIGSLLVIFESRPEVIANIVSLSLKSGNACILKGGKESINTFKIMAEIINKTISSSFDELHVPMAAVQLIETRDDVNQLLAMDGIIDLVVPRGSNALVKRIKDNTKIPVLGHADGICAIYADNHLENSISQAKKIILDAKTNYPAGCNAVETLLINRNLNQWDELLKALIEEKVTVHLMPDVKAEFLKLNPSYEDNQFVVDVNQDIEFDQEFLSFDIAVKFVDNVNEAIDHINHHGSKHTDCILTEDEDIADFFPEIHARGPVGLDGLVTYQYQMVGKGQIVGDYVGSGGSREFNHKDLEI